MIRIKDLNKGIKTFCYLCKVSVDCYCIRIKDLNKGIKTQNLRCLSAGKLYIRIKDLNKGIKTNFKGNAVFPDNLFY